MSWQRSIAVGLTCAACGGQVAVPQPGTGGRTALDAGRVITGAGAAATGTGGAATGTGGSATGMDSDAGGKAAEAAIADIANEYCAACPDACAAFERDLKLIPAACGRALVRYVRSCILPDGCPNSPPGGKVAPPPPCPDESAYFECLKSHMTMQP